MPPDPTEASLESLEARVARELELMDHPKTDWVPPRTHPSGAKVHDVVVIGAGQAGLSILFSLIRENIHNIVAFDRNPRGREGPWMTFARMAQLRTNKNVTGPALGFPSLTPRAWYTARHGTTAWDKLVRIPRTEWQDYLDWYREVLDLPVMNDTEVGPLEPETPGAPDSLIRVPLRATGDGGKDGLVYAREVVLANGIEGCGAWVVPDIIADNLPHDRYMQANTEFDVERLRGKRIAVIGANASGFDIAAVALETGAARVDLLVRRPEIPKINAHRPLDSNAWHLNYAALDAETRWRIASHVMRNNQPPPQDSFERAWNLPGFHMHEDATMRAVRMDGDEVVIEIPGGRRITADLVVAATGFVCDLSLRTETSAFADTAALWRDRYTPPPEISWETMSTYPWIDEDFCFTEREPGAAPWLRHIRCFSLGTKPSIGLTGGSASSIRHAVPQLTRALARSLFLGDAEQHVSALLNLNLPDLVIPDRKPPDGER